MSLRLVVLGGTGDAYLVCALVAAFREHHVRPDVEIVLPSKLAAVGGLFPEVRCVVDDLSVNRAERNEALQHSHDNLLFASDVYYVHPCFARSGIRIDQLTAGASVSQADMYRAMLRLPPGARLTLPRLPTRPAVQDSVLMLTEAVSWPNTQPAFWPKLAGTLEAARRLVVVNDRRWSLAQLFEEAAAAEWVIGPQCGVMSILVTGRFPCRKTLASPATEAFPPPCECWWVNRTFPYGYVTKFAGEDHDVEEFRIANDNHAEVIASIVNGVNARRLTKHDPAPVTTIDMPLTPGDFFDRLAVLTVKRERFSLDRRALIEREYLRYVERRRNLTLTDEAVALYGKLLALHRICFALLESAVPGALSGRFGADDHGAMVRLNRDRVALKAAIDRAMRAPYTEVKSYYGAA